MCLGSAAAAIEGASAGYSGFYGVKTRLAGQVSVAESTEDTSASVSGFQDSVGSTGSCASTEATVRILENVLLVGNLRPEPSIRGVGVPSRILPLAF